MLIIAGFFVILSASSGCSALRIGYSTAPDLVYWWLDGYVDLTATQTTRVRESIAQWFAWHRHGQLPGYAALLDKAQTEVVADTTPTRVCEWQAEITQRALQAFDRIVPDAAALTLTLTPKQLLVLERRYAKNNQEFRDDFLQPDMHRRARQTLKRAVDRAEMLYGTLDDAQRVKIAEILTRSPFDPEVWLAERRQRQQDVLHMLRKIDADGASLDQAEAALRAQVRTLEVSPREAYRRYDEQLSVFNCAAAAAVHNLTTVAQRQTAAHRLAGWAGDLRAIAVAGEPVAH